MGRLEGKVAIVTGAGQTPGDTIGNGRATAITFAREGAQVVLADRRPDSAAETQALIAAEGGTSVCVQADVSSPDDCRDLVAECVARFGRLDVLHNNVGIGAGDTNAVDIEPDVWRTIMDVNLTSVLLACKHALPVMREQRSGAIVNVSSIASTCSAPMVAY